MMSRKVINNKNFDNKKDREEKRRDIEREEEGWGLIIDLMQLVS